MSPFGDVDEVQAQRDLVRPLLAPSDPVDAMTAYYALLHDPRRTHLTLHRTSAGNVLGFVAVCQTGRDLFVPLVVLRAASLHLPVLLPKALSQARPYTLVTLPKLRTAIAHVMVLEQEQINRIYVFDPNRYRPSINVMVQPGRGQFRYEIRVRDQVVAAAGVNWQSAKFADVYVTTSPEFQGRGWGKAVGSACIRDLLGEGLLPLFTVSEQNTVAQRLAESLGFRDAGARELECRGKLKQRAG